MMSLNLARTIFAFNVITIVLSCFSPVYAAGPVAEIIGAPTGLTNQTNPVISIAGDGVVAYKYKLDGINYSDEIPVNIPITFSADVTIGNQKFIAGEVALQDFLDERWDFIDTLTFSKVDVDTPIVFLLNPARVTLRDKNILHIEGSSIDQLDVRMNNAPALPAVVVNQSLSAGTGYITYELQTDTPQTDYIRVINHSSSTASFKINLNNMLFASDGDVLEEIQAMPPEYSGEPIERKVWRFIRDNRYNWFPLSNNSWEFSSPALFFNSIGFGFCGNSAALYCHLMTSFGYQARMWFLNGQHTVPEVLINGKWQLYDPDLEIYYYNYQGKVAGVEELAAYPDLITNPINPIPDTMEWYVNGVRFEYSPELASIYSSPNKSEHLWDYDWYYYNPITNYLLNVQIPPGGIFDFPAVFAASVHTTYNDDAPFHTNARLTIPRGWAGDLDTSFVIHSIGYEGPHTLSVIAKDTAGNWQTAPTIATWTTDSWAPVTRAHQDNATDPVKLTVNEPATIYYTVDNSTPTTSSPVYNGPINITLSTILKFFAIDVAGNREGVKCYNAPSVSSVSLMTNKDSPQAPGTVITFTGKAEGISGIYDYIFWLWNPSIGQWSARQGYSANPVWQWNTTGLGPGTYFIQVWARNAGSTAFYEAWGEVKYTLLQPASTVTLTTNTPSPQTVGAVINFTAAASGGSGSYEYMFWLWNPNTRQWGVGQVYSRTAVWKWNTTGMYPGTYSIQVWARNAGSIASYEAWKAVFYTITVPVSSVSLTTDKSSPQVQGAVIKFTAAATGGSGSYEYIYWLRNPTTGQWSALQSYSSNPIWTWNTTGIDTGTYWIQVWARSAGSTAVYEAWTGVAYTISLPAI